jgi:hypothetical protein
MCGSDPLAGVKLDKHVSVYLSDGCPDASNSVRVPSRPTQIYSDRCRRRSEQFPSLKTDGGGSEPQAVRRESGISPVLDWRTSA